ncbi:MAG: TonB-dependent receptor [Flavobacteriaceae bacterium]|nr:TonB-dependent receptor [Flavobacteriaceae bacterium]
MEQNSSIDQQSFYGIAQWESHLTDFIKLKASGYLQRTNFKNPFILDFKEERQTEFGARVNVQYEFKMLKKQAVLNAGFETQRARTKAENFTNTNGIKDSLRFSDLLQPRQLFFYQNLDWKASQALNITAGLSQNLTRLDIDRRQDEVFSKPGRVVREFEVEWIPRIAAVYDIDAQKSLYANISFGYSPPSIDEVRTNEGSVNLDLNPERGINYELGLRAESNTKKLQVDASFFYFRLSNTITTFTDPQGVVLFTNSGSTDQFGVEVQGLWKIVQPRESSISSLSAKAAYTRHFFKFDGLVSNAVVLDGNRLPGVAPHRISLSLDGLLWNAMHISLSHVYVDALPLNNTNTVFQSAYHFSSLQLGYAFTLKNATVELFGGADNLLNQSFSFGNDLNAFGERFYQPAPKRNAYLGLNLVF